MSIFLTVSASLTTRSAAWSSKRGILSYVKGATWVLLIMKATAIWEHVMCIAEGTNSFSESSCFGVSEAYPKTRSSACTSGGTSLHRHLGNSVTLRDDRSACQFSHTTRSLLSEGSFQSLFLCRRSWIRHFAGSRKGAKTPYGSNTDNSWLKKPRFVRADRWKLTATLKESVSVFYTKPM